MDFLRRCFGRCCNTCCSCCCTCGYCCCSPVLGTISDSEDDEPNTKPIGHAENNEQLDVARDFSEDFQKNHSPNALLSIPATVVPSTTPNQPDGLELNPMDSLPTQASARSVSHTHGLERHTGSASTSAPLIAEPNQTNTDALETSLKPNPSTQNSPSMVHHLTSLAGQAITTPLSDLMKKGRMRLRKASRRGERKARQVRRAIQAATEPFMVPPGKLPSNFQPPPVGVAGVAARTLTPNIAYLDAGSLRDHHMTTSPRGDMAPSFTSNATYHTMASNAHYQQSDESRQGTTPFFTPKLPSLSTTSAPLSGAFGSRLDPFRRTTYHIQVAALAEVRGAAIFGQSPPAADLSRQSQGSVASSYHSVQSLDPWSYAASSCATSRRTTPAQQTFSRSHPAHSAAKTDEHAALSAFKVGRLGFGFSGGGFLFPYHLGVVTELLDAGIINESTQLAGASCGSIIVACLSGGLDMHQLVENLLEFADDCRTNGTAGRLRYVIEHFMTKELPANAHVRCSAQAHIQLTKVLPFIKMVMINGFSSKEDLVKCIATSCHIPAFCDGTLVHGYRGGLYMDGGVLRHIPVAPHTDYSAGVSCVPLKFLGRIPGANRLSVLRDLAISPDMFEDFPWPWEQLASMVLIPASDPILLEMIEHGKRDARRWSQTVGIEAHIGGTSYVSRSPSTSHQPDHNDPWAAHNPPKHPHHPHHPHHPPNGQAGIHVNRRPSIHVKVPRTTSTQGHAHQHHPHGTHAHGEAAAAHFTSPSSSHNSASPGHGPPAHKAHGRRAGLPLWAEPPSFPGASAHLNSIFEASSSSLKEEEEEGGSGKQASMRSSREDGAAPTIGADDAVSVIGLVTDEQQALGSCELFVDAHGGNPDVDFEFNCGQLQHQAQPHQPHQPQPLQPHQPSPQPHQAQPHQPPPQPHQPHQHQAQQHQAHQPPPQPHQAHQHQAQPHQPPPPAGTNAAGLAGASIAGIASKAEDSGLPGVPSAGSSPSIAGRSGIAGAPCVGSSSIACDRETFTSTGVLSLTVDEVPPTPACVSSPFSSPAVQVFGGAPLPTGALVPPLRMTGALHLGAVAVQGGSIVPHTVQVQPSPPAPVATGPSGTLSAHEPTVQPTLPQPSPWRWDEALQVYCLDVDACSTGGTTGGAPAQGGSSSAGGVSSVDADITGVVEEGRMVQIRIPGGAGQPGLLLNVRVP